MATVQRTIDSETVEQTEVAVTLPYVPTYVVTTETAVALSAANSHVFQLLGSSSNRVLLRRLEVTQKAVATADTRIEFELVRLDTAGTGGTTLTTNPTDPVDDASTAVGMTLPSSKGTEDESLGFRTGTVLIAPATAGHEYTLLLVWDDPTSKPPTIATGGTTGIALKNINTDASATVHVVATFQEVEWS
jgi:hypothetical protein